MLHFRHLDTIDMIVAIDPATTTGCAVGKMRGTPTLAAIRFRGRRETVEDLFGSAVVWFQGILAGCDCEALAIEQSLPAMPKSNFDTQRIAGGLHGIFVGMARARKIPVLIAGIREWRKAALGAGNLSGEVAKRRMLQICDHLGWETGGDHNAAEAAGIWMWACKELERVHG